MKLRWLGIAVVFLLLGASAACGPECPETQTNCGTDAAKLCTDTKTSREHCGACNTKCKSGEVCSDGKCAVSCQEGLTECGGTCVNTKTDNGNCGGCGEACKGGQVCTDGKCEISCLDSQTKCGDVCVSTDTDAAHCGACDTKCDSGQLCAAGKCEVTCAASQTSCEGVCADTKSDVANCGACGTKCEGGQVCSEGKCAVSCQKELTDCTGSCVNTKTDVANCGACGTACKSGELCTDGKCELTCATGTEKCGDACVNTQISALHCGACDTKCDPGNACVAGKCELNCAKDITACKGKCVDLQSDSANCGACETACPAGEVCNAGKCAVFCQKGFTDCSGSCVDIQANAGHCGKCGETCPTGQVCGAGKCVEACAAGELSCANGCTDISNDAANCGACNTACKAGDVCLASKCTTCNNCPNWAVGGSGAGTDIIRDVAADAAGNVYVIGYFADFLKFGSGSAVISAGSNDIFVAKISPSGKALWIKRAGGSSSDYGYGIAVDSKGNVLITGGFQGTADFGATKLTSAGGYDIFAAKLDKDGAWLWAKGYGSTSSDYGYGIGADTKDAVYVTGYYYLTTTFGTTSLTSVGSSDIFLLKLDDKGAEVWAGSAGSTSTDYGYALAVDSKDNVYITGRFYSTITWGTVSLTSVGGADVFVAKFDSLGKIVWANSAGGSSTDQAFGIAVDANGVVVVGGEYSKGTGGMDFITGATPPVTINLQSNGSYDAFIAQLDASGKWVWAIGGGTSGISDYIRDLAIDSKGNVWAAGHFTSTTATFGGVVMTAPSSSADGFILQIDKTGKVLGGTNFGGTSSDYAYGIAIDGNDNVYIGGYGAGVMNFGKTQILANGTEIFVARYNARTEPICPGDNPTICNNACVDTQSDVTNCGACSTLCPVGNVCGGGKCLAPPTGLILQEINTGVTDYVVLKNTGTTDVQLKGVWLYWNDSSTSFTSTDIHEELPLFLLKAGSTVIVIESSGSLKTGELKATDDTYVGQASQFTVMLCFGECQANSATNVMDVFQVGASPGPLPTGITFFPSTVDVMVSPNSESTHSYVRNATSGANPTFAKSDWTIGTKTRP